MHQLDAEDSREKQAALADGADVDISDADVTDIKSLKRRGHMEVAAGQFENAINAFSLALKLARDSDEEARMLCHRSNAFASLCRKLRSIPAAQSEAHALYGLDPFTLAQLALKDAERAVTLQPKWATAYLQQGGALFLVERYEDAQAALVEGLSLEPGNRSLQEAMAAVREALSNAASTSVAQSSGTTRSGRAVERCDDTDCVLCLKLLFEPVTTPCGHTFCRACFARTTDHSNKCPMCRTVLHVGRQLPQTVALAHLLERSFPEEYAARRAETRSAAAEGAPPAGDAPIPLFVMSCMMPGEKMALNIFEPRYRLMVRRCMEGARRFGMATVGPSHALHEVACECEILECQPQPDGRFYLEVVGRRRFKIQQSWEQDGYRVAAPRYFADEAPPAGSPEAAELAALAGAVASRAELWVDKVKAYARGRRGIRVMELLQRAGEKPAAGDAEALSFWTANLLPMETADRLRLLSLTHTRDRLAYELALFDENAAAGETCAVM
ncbi:LON peptidase N-terminal domain and RING finger protein 3 [Coccomyxa sp. Obi]|nr:LON peptidase N-terminal domain and RING finger protein 3 [Coccomyxa sp. Obi]